MPRKRVFVDSNIFGYTVDNKDVIKRDAARKRLDQLQAECDIVISTQVMGELYNCATRFIKMEKAAARAYVRNLERFEVAQISTSLISDGIDISILNDLPFWDSLLLATAATKGCSEFISEDLNHGQVVGGVQIVNPFI